MVETVYKYYEKNVCGCVFFQLNDGLGNLSYLGVEKMCPEHDNAVGEIAYNNWHENIIRRSNTQNFFMANLASHLFNTNESGALELKSGIIINYIWTGTEPNRILNVTVTGFNLTNQQKNTIQNLCDSKFGAGKVVIG